MNNLASIWMLLIVREGVCLAVDKNLAEDMKVRINDDLICK